MTRHYSAAAFLCAFSAGTAIASTTWDQGGTGTGISTNSAFEIADGHMVMQISSSYENVEMEDASHPMSGAAGPCFGAVEVSSSAVSGGGICAFTDSAGDKVVLHWHADGMDASGALTGSWKLSGGTGHWDGAEGGGTFSSLTDQATGKFVNTITSSVTLP
ncbi:hypothetical protein KUV26_02300 [Leisingera daeponensis]|uniref:Avidin n=1 Tax=Leisingera daeponensis TaxID=405746 RepID=A0ABS7NAP1_9RHOB|nr:hypothetical protein [Leisingera daeponensis]MBY6055266.1 hypothetical protein [Leisingera daeponensis]MBY6138258.1 hypothetical protein [Leisingera daeponensis]